MLPRSHHWKFFNFLFVKERNYHRYTPTPNSFLFTFSSMPTAKITPIQKLVCPVSMHVCVPLWHVYAPIKFVSYCFVSLEYLHICLHIIDLLLGFLHSKLYFFIFIHIQTWSPKSLILTVIEYSIVWRKQNLSVPCWGKIISFHHDKQYKKKKKENNLCTCLLVHICMSLSKPRSGSAGSKGHVSSDASHLSISPMCIYTNICDVLVFDIPEGMKWYLIVNLF